MEKMLEEKVKGKTPSERIVYLGRITDYILRLNGYHRNGEPYVEGLGRGEFVRVK